MSEAARFRMTREERAALEEAARLNGGTISDALRTAIRVAYMEPKTKIEGGARVHETAGATPQTA